MHAVKKDTQVYYWTICVIDYSAMHGPWIELRQYIEWNFAY